MNNAHIDVDAVKLAANGRWPELLAAVGGFDPQVLDSRHHPCPRCGGTDRFRMINEQAGAVLCNQCFAQGNGDGLAAIQWRNGWTFGETIKAVAGHLGINGGERKPVDIVAEVARLKRMPLESFTVFGAHSNRRGNLEVARVPMFDQLRKECSYFDLATISPEFLKGMSAKGMPVGLFVAKWPEPGDVVLIVEGPKDAAALHGLGLLAVGLPTCEMAVKFARVFTGCNVIVIPDRDITGEKKAKVTAARLKGVAASVCIATLPGEMKAKDGDGVREVLALRDGEELLRQSIEDAKPWEPSTDGEANSTPPEPRDEQVEYQLPTVLLPGGSTSISMAAARFGDLLAETGRFFIRGNSVSELVRDKEGQPILSLVKPAGLASLLESVARLVTIKQTPKGEMESPSTCSESTARLILNAREFLIRLPPIHVLSACPVLIERDGQLVSIVGYDRKSGVLAAGELPPEISLNEAKKLLNEITAEFRHTTPADRARHLATIITPALVLGGMLGGRAPVDLTEANESQSGKGFKNKITAAVYEMKLRTITQRQSGVGGIEESFSGALVSGAALISLDNMRGKLNLPSLESFLTEDTFQARVPYSGDVEIDARRVVVMMTSNRAEITPDFANRSCITRIIKQPDGYHFCQYPEGNLLDHVRGNQPRYLGAVFAIIKAWHAAGKLRTTETQHDFRQWATVLDWIVQNLLQCPPLLDGHRETQRRMATPALNWLRDVALAIERSGRMEQWLLTHHILDVVEAGDLEIPGAKEDTDLQDEVSRGKVLRAIGKQLGGCFTDDRATIDGVIIQRRHGVDDEGRKRPEYQFRKACETPVSPNGPECSPNANPPSRNPRNDLTPFVSEGDQWAVPIKGSDPFRGFRVNSGDAKESAVAVYVEDF